MAKKTKLKLKSCSYSMMIKKIKYQIKMIKVLSKRNKDNIYTEFLFVDEISKTIN